MYKLLLYSRSEVVLLDKINAIEVVKAIKLFNSRNEAYRIELFEYSANADHEDEYFSVLHLWK